MKETNYFCNDTDDHGWWSKVGLLVMAANDSWCASWCQQSSQASSCSQSSEKKKVKPKKKSLGPRAPQRNSWRYGEWKKGPEVSWADTLPYQLRCAAVPALRWQLFCLAPLPPALVLTTWFGMLLGKGSLDAPVPDTCPWGTLADGFCRKQDVDKTSSLPALGTLGLLGLAGG